VPEIEMSLAADDPLASSVGTAIRAGDLDALRDLLDEHPGLANATIAGRRGSRGTPLLMVAGWPGYYPNGPAVVEMLVAAGAEPDLDSGCEQPETPLHWAASNDDVDVAVALIDAGARLDTPGGSIGTPLDNAVGYGCWHVARLLVERGAPVDALWHAAALGLLARLDELLAGDPPPTQQQLDQAFWHACCGAELRAAERLLGAGASIDASPDYAGGRKPLDAATSNDDTRRGIFADWLRARGATPAAGD
jgi:ankyrin repeat protein